MARKPNYRFDRMERDRAKAAKKAERLKSKQDRAATRAAADTAAESERRPESEAAEAGERRSGDDG